MRISLGVLAIFASCALAATTPVCDPNSDACRAVMDGTACFNENNASTGSKNAILACLTGTDGAGTPTQKVRANCHTPDENMNAAKFIDGRCAEGHAALLRFRRLGF
jgi:hypothetical protein